MYPQYILDTPCFASADFFFSVTEQYIFDTIIEYTVAPCFVSAAIPEQALMDETKALDLVREASEKLEAAMEQV